MSGAFMADNDSGADMNSTPLSKLPPPPIMSDQPSLPQNATYQDVLKSVELSRSKPIPVATQAPQMQMPPQMQMQEPQAQMQMPHHVVHQPRARRPRRPIAYDDVDDVASPVTKTSFKFILPGLVVAAIVFVVLFKIAPLIATTLPFSVDAVTGKFTTSGLLVVSFLSGGTFLFADEMLKKHTGN